MSVLKFLPIMLAVERNEQKKIENKLSKNSETLRSMSVIGEFLLKSPISKHVCYMWR